MPISIKDARRILKEVLLKGPRAPERPGGVVFAQIAASLGLEPGEKPVTGIALSVNDAWQMKLDIFLDRPRDGFADRVGEALGLADFDIAGVVSGEIHPTGRPARGGESLGEGASGGKSGTLGVAVRDMAGQEYILTCSHVIGTLNTAVRGSDVVWQPSSGDGGGSGDVIGKVHDFSDIVLDGVTENRVDAALVLPDVASDLKDEVLSVGRLAGSAVSLTFRDFVKKHGWKTGLTDGHFLYEVDFICPYPEGDALFVDQLGIVGSSGVFSEAGDSGSVVVTAGDELAGLLFADAGDIHMSFANPVAEVLDFFGVTTV